MKSLAPKFLPRMLPRELPPELLFLRNGMPRKNLIGYTRPLVDSIGILSLVVISGSDQSDWVLTLPDSSTVTDILGVDNDFYSAGGVPLEMSWVEMQTAADGNVYFYAGRKGTALYSVDMSADESTIMRVLGGLYVPQDNVLWMDTDILPSDGDILIGE